MRRFAKTKEVHVYQLAIHADQALAQSMLVRSNHVIREFQVSIESTVQMLISTYLPANGSVQQETVSNNIENNYFCGLF